MTKKFVGTFSIDHGLYAIGNKIYLGEKECMAWILLLIL
jgi:hypothetical protein